MINSFFYLIFLTFFSFISNTHEIKKIDDCRCDEACYTKEVTNLKCDNKSASFKSSSLPNNETHDLMIGIKASNQQFPSTHQIEAKLPLKFSLSNKKTITEAGAIGIAVNGVPLFDPSTQAKKNSSGKRPHTLDVGELDYCGGHAGRGDDYHYHIAPKCLIEELGEDYIDNKKRPIGYARDGFPILALGWFNKANNVEDILDECRGMKDLEGNYFYNVKLESKWDIINCYSGKLGNLQRDKWLQRKDKNGNDIVGKPMPMIISAYTGFKLDGDQCHFLEGKFTKANILQTNMSVKKISNQDGTIFYCNSNCYGLFFEAEKNPNYKGRVMYYDLITNDCSNDLNLNKYEIFEAYNGKEQAFSPPAPTKP